MCHSDRQGGCATGARQNGGFTNIMALRESNATVLVDCGLMTSLRSFGKVTFIKMLDASESMQVFVARDDLGTEAYQLFKKYDIGDILGVEGDLFRTKTGELTIRAKTVDLVTKSMLAQGTRAKLYGPNLIGLKRRGFSSQTVGAIKKAYRIIFRSGLMREEALQKASAEFPDVPEVARLVEFVRGTVRGITADAGRSSSGGED